MSLRVTIELFLNFFYKTGHRYDSRTSEAKAKVFEVSKSSVQTDENCVFLDFKRYMWK